jgi:hypothetical protein
MLVRNTTIEGFGVGIDVHDGVQLLVRNVSLRQNRVGIKATNADVHIENLTVE